MGHMAPEHPAAHCTMDWTPADGRRRLEKTGEDLADNIS